MSEWMGRQPNPAAEDWETSGGGGGGGGWRVELSDLGCVSGEL